jgi:hypothetical protein
MWFTNETYIVGNATMPKDSYLLTYPKSAGAVPYPGAGGKPIDVNPWYAPGSSKVWSPCGIAGGNPYGCPYGDESSRGKQCPGGGSGWGIDALNDPDLQQFAVMTEWKRGSVVEAGWGIRANHGIYQI